MEQYNVLNETDYYPRSKYASDLNPVHSTYDDWTASVAEAVDLAPSLLSAVTWLREVEVWLSGPTWNEMDMFASAGVELARLRREARA